MLSRFSTVIQNAVDALAPPAPLLEDFKYHWKMIMKYYVKRESFGKVAIECTNIPGHLDQLLKILIEEEGNQDQGSTGPCLEYLLHHHLLDLLATLACTDCPPGMKQITLCFIRKLITQLKQPVLPHVSVYVPIQRIVSLCNGKQASPTESHEIHFLCTLCGVICKHPQLINVFNNPQIMEDRRISICSNLSSFSSEEVKSNTPEASTGTLFCYSSSDLEVCREQVAEEGTESSCAQTGEFTPVIPASPASSCQGSWCDSTTQKFFMLDTLLSYYNSADSRVVVKACEGVMVMASLQSDAFARSVTCHSDLCNVLTSKLDDLFAEIPSGIDPNDIDDIQVNWGLDSHSWTESTLFPGCKQVVAFFAWLDYCDQLVRESHPIISMALARSIRNQFFELVLGSALMRSTNYSNKVFIIAFISKCLKQISAPALLTEFHYWIVGESREPDLPGMSTCPIRQHLIENCFNEQDEISLEALRLFEVLLEKPSEHVLHCLVLVYLSARAYYDCSAVDSFIESWSDEEDERERQRDSPSLDFSPGSSPVSRTLAPSNIDKLLNSLLMLLPQHLHSTTDPDELGYEQYVQDADKQYQACITKCMCFAWPTEATFPDPQEFDAGSSDSRPEADHGQSFYEGPFLRMLFTRLVRLPHQPYEINLQLTGLVSRLAMLPHPYLHEYLLNPLLPLLPDASSLFGTLQLVANEVASQVPTLKNYKQLLNGTRQRLLGDAVDVQEETNNMLESVVVLEEFCKELAAITFVKYHHSS